MGYIGEEMKDMLIQKAYGKLKSRGFEYPISSCYYRLLGILEREGAKALYEYANTVKIR